MRLWIWILLLKVSSPLASLTLPEGGDGRAAMPTAADEIITVCSRPTPRADPAVDLGIVIEARRFALPGRAKSVDHPDVGDMPHLISRVVVDQTGRIDNAVIALPVETIG